MKSNFFQNLIFLVACTHALNCGEGLWFYGFIDPGDVTFEVIDTYSTSSKDYVALGGSTTNA